jgi:hypothetical protein
MRKALLSKFRPMLWLALVLPIVATSCTTSNAGRRPSTGGTEMIKGGQLMMELNRRR